MKAIVFDQPGDESVLRLEEDVPSPSPSPDEVRLRVRATAVNRADLLQRRGMYPPPAGASPILGLEAAGEILEVGRRVRGWKVGQRAMALLPGGGYAEEVTVHAGSLMRVPDRLTWEQAGAIPETFLTAFLNLFWLGQLEFGQSVLIHGGSSGVGTAAIQLAREAGARVLCTVGNEHKATRCRTLGAETILYPTEAFEKRARELTSNRGVDVILDCIGGSYLEKNLRSLAPGGRLVVIGLQGGMSAELDLGQLLARRLHIVGSVLRSRTIEEKASIVRAFTEHWWQLLDAGKIYPVIDRAFPLAEAAEAHRIVASSVHVGKVVLLC